MRKCIFGTLENRTDPIQRAKLPYWQEHLLFFDINCNIQWLCKRTVKPKTRLHGYTNSFWLSLSDCVLNSIFSWRGLALLYYSVQMPWKSKPEKCSLTYFVLCERNGTYSIVPYLVQWSEFIDYISHNVKNVPSDNCAQRRFRSACAFAPSSQNHYWMHFGWPMLQGFFIRTTKTLIRLPRRLILVFNGRIRKKVCFPHVANLYRKFDASREYENNTLPR